MDKGDLVLSCKRKRAISFIGGKKQDLWGCSLKNTSTGKAGDFELVYPKNAGAPTLDEVLGTFGWDENTVGDDETWKDWVGSREAEQMQGAEQKLYRDHFQRMQNRLDVAYRVVPRSVLAEYMT